MKFVRGKMVKAFQLNRKFEFFESLSLIINQSRAKNSKK